MANPIDEIKTELLSASEEKEDFKKALKEWDYVESHLIEPGEDSASCELCGHHPIREICTVVNRINGNQFAIGNKCILWFLGEEGQKAHKKAITKIKKEKEFATFSRTEDYAKTIVLTKIRTGFSKVSRKIASSKIPTKNEIGIINATWNLLEMGKSSELANILKILVSSESKYKQADADFILNLIKNNKNESSMSDKQKKWLNDIRRRYLKK